MNFNFDDLSKLGIVVGFISLSFAIQRISNDLLIKATFLMVLIALLVIIASLNRKRPGE